MVALGYTTKEAAVELGRTPGAVYAKVQKYKMRGKLNKRPWTETEKDLVRSGQTVPTQELADMLGRTRMAVAHMRRALGFRKTPEGQLCQVKTRITQLGRMREVDLLRSLERERRPGL